MKIYTGRRDENGNCIVHVLEDGKPARKLRKRLDLVNHSPTGFEWGYGGSGPAQLALAILADCLGDDELADRLHQDFKFAVIAGIPRASDWRLDEGTVRQRAYELMETSASLRMTATRPAE
jgi:hypothetical protein